MSWLSALFLSAAIGAFEAAGAAAAGPTQSSSNWGSARFVLDGNRVYAQVAFRGSDGSWHRSLAYVDTGSADMSVSSALLTKLHWTGSRPLSLRVGRFPLIVSAEKVQNDPTPPRYVAGREVDAVLPASVLENFEVVFDYRKHLFTVARPGFIPHRGVPTPVDLDQKNGLIAVDADIDGKRYAVTIDNGSAWTWFRQSHVRTWIASHPSYRRGIGAVGASNMMMIGDLEASGILARLPSLHVGTLTLTNVDLLGPGPTKAFKTDLFDWYSQKNAVPVLGWLGGNVLKQFRLTIDYSGRTLYWERESPPDAGELNQVGLTLRREGAEYKIAGVSIKDGHVTVPGAKPGDTLISVDGRPMSGATLGSVFRALHGSPGERRILNLGRDGRRLDVEAKVTAF